MSKDMKITVIESTKDLIQQTENHASQKLRVAAYARVSTEQEEQQSSYEAQVNYYTAYIQNNPDWEFVGVFADEGITGTNTKKRDGFNLMIEKALNGKIDLILTKSISRFARNTVDTLQIVRQLKTAGVEVRFEKENLHTFDPKCEMMLTILASLAQEESRSISENVRWGKKRSMEEGKVSLAYSHFLGYRKGEDGRPEIVEEEAIIVRKIYELFLDGLTPKHIAAYLTEHSIPTPSGKKVWYLSTVKSILSNEKYKGNALLQKTYTTDYLTKKVKKNNGEMKQYLVENSHDAIIEPEIFDTVQEKLKEYEQQTNRVQHYSPFASKIICGDCGSFYGRKVKYNRGNKNQRIVWYCNQKYNHDKKCLTPTIREAQIKAVFEMVLSKLGYTTLEYSDQLWLALVDKVIISSDGVYLFKLKNGDNITINSQE
ncbi:MAG: recombinase family protein [Ruminococcus sp.]|nr:recombinase family protein [Ruminococcus sp.]